MNLCDRYRNGSWSCGEGTYGVTDYFGREKIPFAYSGISREDDGGGGLRVTQGGISVKIWGSRELGRHWRVFVHRVEP